jgi:dipeptidase E
VRAYLSSFGLGDHPEHLAQLCRSAGASAAVIANAIDAVAASERAARVEAELVGLRRLGFTATELDLTTHFTSPGELGEALRRHQLIWVRGGNVFVLREAMRRSGADLAIVEALAHDEIVYAGYSAGPCVLGPSIEVFEAAGTPHIALRDGQALVIDGTRRFVTA